MNYKVEIPLFEGPLDLLLHLIKQNNMDIYDISIEEITKQYLEYINLMEKLNLNIASEYLVMAAELLEIKSSSLLPKNIQETEEDEFDPKENLINRLLEYEQYKKISNNLKDLESFRKEIYTREPENLSRFNDNDFIDYGVDINDLISAFTNFMEQKELDKPLNTKITNKEYNIGKRCKEIKKMLKNKNRIMFKELFKESSKQYIIITFLAILSMYKNQEIELEQEHNFNDILIKEKGDNNEL